MDADVSRQMGGLIWPTWEKRLRNVRQHFMIDLAKKKEDGKNRIMRNCHRPHRSWTIRNKMVKQHEKKTALLHCLRSSHNQTMKRMTNGTTLIKKGAAELHELRCKDRPALVDDDAVKAEDAADALLLLLMLLELVEPVVVVPVGGRTDVSTAVEVLSVKEVGIVIELGMERDVVGSVAPGMEPEEGGDDEVSELGEEIRVMAKAGLVSPESPNKTMR